MRLISSAIRRRTSGRSGAWLDQWPKPLDGFGDGEQTLHPRQVDAAVVHEMLDEAETFQLVVRVHANASDGPRRTHQPEPLVLAEGLRVHIQQPGSHADKVKIRFLFHISRLIPM